MLHEIEPWRSAYDEQRLAKFDGLSILDKAAAALLNVRCARISQRRNGQ